ncbi:ATP-grasp domain-containing protein [Methylothermus subterraneus]
MERPFLLVAHSARMLAQSLARAGWPAVALDRFADLDTRSACRAWYRVPERDGRFDPQALEEKLSLALAECRPQAWVYGSGMEALPELIAKFSERCPLFGNGAQVVRICTDPRAFFPWLDRLGIPYPEVSWTAPAAASGWLVKRGGEGGRGVSVYRGENGDGYYQRRLAGAVYTLAFLAGMGQVWWHGFNTLYQADYNTRFPFLFAGAINRADLSREVAGQVIGYARRLSRALDLRGLHGLDFMLDNGVPKVLELNPRPGAALGIWDTAWPEGLLAAQVRVCRGEPVAGFLPVPVKGFKIVFAPQAVQIPAAWRWPSWCADRTPPETMVPAGAPVCSVNASGRTVAEVEAQLAAREAWVIKQLWKEKKCNRLGSA